jgi:hypothetical protein
MSGRIERKLLMFVTDHWQEERREGAHKCTHRLKHQHMLMMRLMMSLICGAEEGVGERPGNMEPVR